MIEFNRSEIKSDPDLTMLKEAIRKKHRISEHTIETLWKNREVKNFCEQARHYAILTTKSDLYVHYDVTTWLKAPSGAVVRIDAMGIYDDFIEYESTRVKELHGSKTAVGKNLN